MIFNTDSFDYSAFLQLESFLWLSPNRGVDLCLHNTLEGVQPWPKACNEPKPTEGNNDTVVHK